MFLFCVLFSPVGGCDVNHQLGGGNYERVNLPMMREQVVHAQMTWTTCEECLDDSMCESVIHEQVLLSV
jgi:hypothetical protein